MSLYILGTGRSGTKSAAAYYGGEHEPSSEMVIAAAAYYSCGRFDIPHAAAILRLADIPEVSAHYAYAPLIDVLAHNDPDAEFLWVRRNRAKTVDSMVEKDWYAPRWDGLWPMQLTYWETHPDRITLVMEPNHEAFRITPVLLGRWPWWAWARTSQRERCAWWVVHVEALIHAARREYRIPEVWVENSNFPVLNRGTIRT